MCTDILFKSFSNILRFQKLPFLFIPGRFYDPKNQGFQFFQVTVTYGQIDTESIPRIPVSIPQVVGETRTEIACQSDVMDFPTPIKCIHSLPAADISANNVLILLQCLPRNVFQSAERPKVCVWPCHNSPLKALSRMDGNKAPSSAAVSVCICFALSTSKCNVLTFFTIVLCSEMPRLGNGILWTCA